MTIASGADIDHLDFIRGINTESTQTSHATPSINVENVVRHTMTAQSVDITSMSSGLSGTPIGGQKLEIIFTPIARTPAFSYVASTRTNNSAAAITGTKPTGTTDGDIMFTLVGAIGATNYPSSVPSGWTLICNNYMGSSLSLYYKIASSEGASYYWDFGTSLSLYIEILTYRGGFNPVNPIELNSISNTVYQSNDTIVRATSIGVVKQYSPLLFFGIKFAAGESFTKPSAPTSGWVEDVDSSGSGVETFTACSMVWGNNGLTGDIDATLTGAATNKHAFAIALNPELDVTWGSSYNEVGEKLPNKIYGPNTTTVKLQYNSSTSKFDTQGQDTSKTNRILLSSVTKDISSSTTTKLAHGFSKRPKVVRIDGKHSFSSGISHATAIVTESQMVSNSLFGETSNGVNESNTATFRFSTDNSNYIEALITIDTTYINFVWTKTGSPSSSNAYIICEAEI